MGMEHTELPPKASSESHLEAQILGLYLDRAALREASQMAKQRNLPNLPPDPRERKMPGGGRVLYMLHGRIWSILISNLLLKMILVNAPLVTR